MKPFQLVFQHFSMKNDAILDLFLASAMTSRCFHLLFAYNGVKVERAEEFYRGFPEMRQFDLLLCMPQLLAKSNFGPDMSSELLK